MKYECTFMINEISAPLLWSHWDLGPTGTRGFVLYCCGEREVWMLLAANRVRV